MDLIWNALVFLAMILLYLAPVAVVYFVVRAWKQVRSHHQLVERELARMNHQLARLLGEGGQRIP